MRTLFTMGFASQDVFAQTRPHPFTLGQETVDGNKILADVKAGEDKMGVINQWMSNRPAYLQILGPDADRFTSMLKSTTDAYGTVIEVYNRLATNDKEAWFVSRSELDTVNGWVAVMNELYNIIASHPEMTPGGPKTQPVVSVRPGQPARPGGAAAPVPVTPSAGPSPLVVGVGAAAVVGLLAVALS